MLHDKNGRSLASTLHDDGVCCVPEEEEKECEQQVEPMYDCRGSRLMPTEENPDEHFLQWFRMLLMGLRRDAMKEGKHEWAGRLNKAIDILKNPPAATDGNGAASGA